MHGKAVKVRHCPATVSGWETRISRAGVFTAKAGRTPPEACRKSGDRSFALYETRFEGERLHAKTDLYRRLCAFR